MRRATTGVVLGAAVLLVLTGCSPKPLPLVAVYVDSGGAPQVLIQPCDGDSVRGPRLRGMPTGGAETGTAATSGTDETSPVGWDTHGRHSAADFPLFSPPAPWRAEPLGEQGLLPGYTYELSFGDPADSYTYFGTVRFDSAQLARLEPDHVWARGRSMSRDEFEKTAEKAC